jgi:hypothetical protein
MVHNGQNGMAYKRMRPERWNVLPTFAQHEWGPGLNPQYNQKKFFKATLFILIGKTWQERVLNEKKNRYRTEMCTTGYKYTYKNLSVVRAVVSTCNASYLQGLGKIAKATEWDPICNKYQ